MQVPPAGRAPRLTASPGHPPQLEVEDAGSSTSSGVPGWYSEFQPDTKFQSSTSSGVPGWYPEFRLGTKFQSSRSSKFQNAFQSSELVSSAGVPRVPEFQADILTSNFQNSPSSKVPQVPEFQSGIQSSD